MEPILNLIAESGQVPPTQLEDPSESTPFFEVGPQGFLLRTPSGGRLHYAPGQGISIATPPDRPSDDLAPIVRTSGFAAAGWLDGRVPLWANAVRLDTGRLVLIASDRDDVHEAMAAALSDAFGFAVSDAPVVIDPEDPSRVCTNGQPMTIRRTTKEATEPPVREGSRRLRTDRPAIDGTVVHPCAGLVCVEEGTAAQSKLSRVGLMNGISEIKKHIFMPLAGTAIWGAETIEAAHMVLSSNLPMLRYSMPAGRKPDAELAADLLDKLKSLGKP